MSALPVANTSGVADDLVQVRRADAMSKSLKQVLPTWASLMSLVTPYLGSVPRCCANIELARGPLLKSRGSVNDNRCMLELQS